MEITIGLIAVLAIIGVIFIVIKLQERGEEFGLRMFASLQFVLLAVGTIFAFIYLINSGQYVVLDKEGYTYSFYEISNDPQKRNDFEKQIDWAKLSPVREKHRQSNQRNSDEATLNSIKRIFSSASSFQNFEDKLRADGFGLGTVGGKHNSLLAKICYFVFFSVSLFLNVRRSTPWFGLAYTFTQALLCALLIIALILLILMAMSKENKRKRRR